MPLQGLTNSILKHSTSSKLRRSFKLCAETRPQIATPSRSNGRASNGRSITMRPLGPGPTSPSPASTSSSNGSKPELEVVTPAVIPPSSSNNGNGTAAARTTSASTGQGKVVRTKVGSLMPSMRAAAAQVVEAMPAARAPVNPGPLKTNGTGPTSSITSSPAGRATGAALAAPSSSGRPPAPAGPDSSWSRMNMVVSDSQQQQGADFPPDADFKWAQDNYNATTRTIDTWTFFTVFRTRLWLLDQKWSYVGGFTEDKKKARVRSLARYLLESVLGLGPTFIKLGQLSSTRADLFPSEFVDELSKLQDRVPAFSFDKAAAIIEADLGRPIKKLFKSFDPRPIAAASLGQVHRAVLFSGEEVVVKVQRPGLKQLFDIDLNNLRILAEQLDKGDEQNRDFRGIYKECAQVLYDEIDYINEGKNADRFCRNFRDTPWVKVPKVYWEYCSYRVLTLQYLPGIKITNKEALAAASIDLDVVARRATEGYLIQILKHGFFHADPHPGNIAVAPKGTLVFYDFGMMGEIVPGVRERLLDMFYGVYRKDTQAVINALVELGVIKPTGDALTIRRAVSYFLDNLARQTEQQETIQAIGEDLFAIAVDQPFRFPATFTFVLRAFSTLEGIGKTLNPSYKFSEVAKPYATELLDLQNTQSQQALLVSQLQQQATQITAAAAQMPLRIQRMDALLGAVEAGELKLRVRVLEAERAARRAGVMQAATMNVVGAVGFLNIGTMFALNGLNGPATVALGLAGVFGVLMLQGFKRVERLDKFEKEIRG